MRRPLSRRASRRLSRSGARAQHGSRRASGPRDGSRWSGGQLSSLRDGDGAEVATHIGMLIGVGQDGTVGDRQTLFFSARRFVEALALQQPTVLVFEDIHVAAASLLDLLETLASRVRDVPLLLLT